MIDSEGYRANVAAIICNGRGQVLWARRIGSENSWQFPQGGIQPNETPEQALYRELNEEVGLDKSDVDVIAMHRSWLKYDLPKQYQRRHDKPLCVGQKQRWFLVQLKSSEQKINLNNNHEPEFEDWRWVSYWYPIHHIVEFKTQVYRQALKGLSSAHFRLVKSNLRSI